MENNQHIEEVETNERAEIMDVDGNQVAELNLFDSSESESEDDFLGFEINSQLSINEYVGYNTEYSQVSFPNTIVPVNTRLEISHTPFFQNINITPHNYTGKHYT